MQEKAVQHFPANCIVGLICTLNWHMCYFYHFAWSYRIFSLPKYLSTPHSHLSIPILSTELWGLYQGEWPPGLRSYSKHMNLHKLYFVCFSFSGHLRCKHYLGRLEGRESELQIWSFWCLVTDLTESFTRRKVSNVLSNLFMMVVSLATLNIQNCPYTSILF